MIAKLFNNTVALIINVRINRSSWTQIGPCRILNREINTHPVSGNESGLRRAPGMKAHMIQPVFLAFRVNIRIQSLYLNRRIACLRKNGTFQGAPQENGPVIHT